MLKCNYLKKYSVTNTTESEKAEFIKHFKSCDSCNEQLKKSNLDRDDVIEAILYDIESIKDCNKDSADYRADKEKVINNIREKIKEQEQESRVGWQEKINNFFSSSILKPVFATVLLAMMVGGYLYTTYIPATYLRPMGSGEVYAHISLSFGLVREDDNGQLTKEEKGIPDSYYSTKDDLIFRFDMDMPGYIYLINTEKKFNINLAYALNENTIIPRGVHDLKINGKIQAYPLSNLKGEQYFIIIHSRKKIEDISDSAKALSKTIIEKNKETKIDYDFFKIIVN